MHSQAIRAAFLEYFKKQGHTVVPSSSLVPGNDPTLLFTNAGMVQFKDVFLGLDKRSYARAASSQRCVRAGGKHNDLENVGYTARHHTFFEMLGNFSFGDYFKREAIQFAWGLLTDVFKLPKEKLWITVFKDDDEAADIWLKEIKVDPKRFSRCGEKDNFWAMGDTGPCGPCTEIFYDHGPDIAGGPPGSPDADGDRYIEIWNLVFMQFNRSADGKLTPLPKPSVDTGMGLERLTAVLQAVHNNYETDLFLPLIEAVKELAGEGQGGCLTSMRVIADHIRSCSFLIVDGVRPSNEGRGYVLRRIIRRALRHGHLLELKEPFFYRLVAVLAKVMGDAYPELVAQQKTVADVLKQEEEQFGVTLTQGVRIFEDSLKELSSEVIPGDVVFRLYDTYGFPVDLTEDMARERGLTLDMAGFENAMEQQRSRARAASRFSAEEVPTDLPQGATDFSGHEHLTHSARIVALYQGPKPVTQLSAGDTGQIILDRTPFYAEGGGQVGDQGWLKGDNTEFWVEDTQKQGHVFLHLGTLKKGKLVVGQSVTAEVDTARRKAIMRNHTATHLLHAALRKILGEKVQQKGSLVAPDRLRFDFTYPVALSESQLEQVESLINQIILQNIEASTTVMTPKEAVEQGALALFGEKYGDTVRVLKIADFSMELCGGTHAHATGDIGLFKITTQSGIAAGVRRLEAVTGEGALQWVREKERILAGVASVLKESRLEEIPSKLQVMLTHQRELEKEIEQLQKKFALGQVDVLAQAAKSSGNHRVLIKAVENLDAKGLRDLIDALKQKLERAVIVLASKQTEKTLLAVGITNNLTKEFNAIELVNRLAAPLGGKGGGRPDFAQAGVKFTGSLQELEQKMQKEMGC